MRALDIFTEQTYVLKSERHLPAAEQTRFKYRILTAEQDAYVRDLSAQTGPATGTLAILDLGMTGLENFVGAKGEAVKLERELGRPKVGGFEYPWDRRSLDQIPGHARSEFASEILSAGQRLAEEDAKKS